MQSDKLELGVDTGSVPKEGEEGIRVGCGIQYLKASHEGMENKCFGEFRIGFIQELCENLGQSAHRVASGESNMDLSLRLSTDMLQERDQGLPSVSEYLRQYLAIN
jgi:hypothetical protein